MTKFFGVVLLLTLVSCSGNQDAENSKNTEPQATLTVIGGSDSVFIYEQTNLQCETNLLYSLAGSEVTEDLTTGVYQIEVDSGKRVTLYHEAGEHPVITVDSLPNVSGSKGTAWAAKYEVKRKSTLKNLVYPVRDEIKKAEKLKVSKATIDSLYEQEGIVFRAYLDTMMAYVAVEGPEHIGLYASALRWNGDSELEAVRKKLNSIKKQYGNKPFVEQMETKLGLLERLATGEMAPDFELKTYSDEQLNLADALGNKYTLVDFWASWCGPCRQESNVLNETYKRFKKHGFEIVSVSIDVDEEKWKQAVDLDQRIWTNVRTSGYESETACKYGISSVPFSILLDEEGRIVAKQLHGKALITYLEKHVTP